MYVRTANIWRFTETTIYHLFRFCLTFPEKKDGSTGKSIKLLDISQIAFLTYTSSQELAYNTGVYIRQVRVILFPDGDFLRVFFSPNCWSFLVLFCSFSGPFLVIFGLFWSFLVLFWSFLVFFGRISSRVYYLGYLLPGMHIPANLPFIYP